MPIWPAFCSGSYSKGLSTNRITPPTYENVFLGDPIIRSGHVFQSTAHQPSPTKSGRGRLHSTMLRVPPRIGSVRPLLDCASPLALSPHPGPRPSAFRDSQSVAWIPFPGMNTSPHDWFGHARVRLYRLWPSVFDTSSAKRVSSRSIHHSEIRLPIRRFATMRAARQNAGRIFPPDQIGLKKITGKMMKRGRPTPVSNPQTEALTSKPTVSHRVLPPP